MNNIYTLSKRKPLTNEGNQSVYYNCRLFRTKNYTSIDIAKRQQNQSRCITIECPAKLKVIFYGKSRAEVSCLGSGLHNHNLQKINVIKYNTTVCELAVDEVFKSCKSL